jgi:branched-chain amino acid aminotransferase
VTAVTKIDHRPVGAGVMGPITMKLRTMYEDILRGRNKKYEHWNLVV